MQFPASRQQALARLEEFLGEAPRYAARRNHVLPGHPHVSRLSAAIRHRLITEAEVVEATLRRYPFRAVEKFLQEVLWRSYWKGWLEMRPQIWQSYAAAVSRKPSSEALHLVADGRSPSGIMNYFARELLETGYMHNHARMWWASYWIHHCGLPWELGADHFFRHLLDADSASNTLSWRWVAGLQTRGKTYLATAQNIGKCCAPEILQAAGGIGFGEGVVAEMVREEECVDDTESPLEELPNDAGAARNESTMVVLHDEDFCLETSPLWKVRPLAVLQFVPSAEGSMSVPRADWLSAARSDAARRAKEHFGCDVLACRSREDLCRECIAQNATTLLMMEPFIGPMRDELVGLSEELAGHDIKLVRLRRKWDSALLLHAARGFFPFWNKVGRLLAKSGMERLA